MQRKTPRTEEDHHKVREMVNENELTDTDPFGSYTGKPADKYETPVQDADDL